MIELDSRTKRGSLVERTYDGRKGSIIAFDSINTVGVEWDNGDIEYMIDRRALDNADTSESN